MLVQRPGFRFQGWLADAAVAGDLKRLTLARTSELPEQVVTPLPDPLPDAEFRAMGRRLLESCLKVVAAQHE